MATERPIEAESGCVAPGAPEEGSDPSANLQKP